MVNTPEITSKSPKKQLQKLLVEPFRSLNSKAAPIQQTSPFLVIIDGLDKCKSEDEQSKILSSIASIINSHHLPFCFLIASHHEPHIRRSFDSPALRDNSYPLCLDDSFKPVDDVCNFLRSAFEGICQKHQHTMASIPKPWPPYNTVQILAGRSSGQFIYASTVIRFIDDEDCHPTDQLEIVLNGSGTGHKTAFKELDLLYQQILLRCPNTSLLCCVLGCMLVLEQPMNATDIEFLLSLCEGEVYLIFCRIQSLVHIPLANAIDSRIVTHHASLWDFLFNPDCSGIFYISQQMCHLDVARCCLSFMKCHGKRTEMDT